MGRRTKAQIEKDNAEAQKVAEDTEAEEVAEDTEAEEVAYNPYSDKVEQKIDKKEIVKTVKEDKLMVVDVFRMMVVLIDHVNSITKFPLEIGDDEDGYFHIYSGASSAMDLYVKIKESNSYGLFEDYRYRRGEDGRKKLYVKPHSYSWNIIPSEIKEWSSK